jgi:hypothetical protein
MTLKNLLGISLDAIKPDRAQVTKLTVGLPQSKVIVLDARASNAISPTTRET